MIPFLSSYDPASSLEGTLDPLGLTMLSEQLATKLVPAVRERMQRIRFLTAMTVGAAVTEALDTNQRHPESPPFLVWEWLVIEAFERAGLKDEDFRGVPGTQVTKHAIKNFGYLDYQSYLKTPLVFGFHGVYKRLAERLRLVDKDLRPGNGFGKRLGEAWADDCAAGEFIDGNPLLEQWRLAIGKAIAQSPVRTKNVLPNGEWLTIASMFAPHGSQRREKRVLREALLSEDPETSLGALKYYWQVFDEIGVEELDERVILRAVAVRGPEYAALIDAIEQYENFSRALSNAFDAVRYHASKASALGLKFPELERDRLFVQIAGLLPDLYRKAEAALNENGGREALFSNRFGMFAEALTVVDLAAALCTHHERVQREKSFAGKNSWFDRVGQNGIVMRRSYCLYEPPDAPLTAFLHFYRSNPLRRFYLDLQ